MRAHGNRSSWKRPLLVLAIAIILPTLLALAHADKAWCRSEQEAAVSSPSQSAAAADAEKRALLMEKELDLGRGDGLLSKCPRSGGRGGGGRGGFGFNSWSGPRITSMPVDTSAAELAKIEAEADALIRDFTTKPGPKTNPTKDYQKPTAGSGKAEVNPVKETPPTPSSSQLLDGASGMQTTATDPKEEDLLGDNAGIFCR
jgi:hypothetical protein